MKFKSQLIFAIFAAVDHLSRPRRKQKFTWTTSSKGHSLWFVFGGFWSILSVSVFQGSLLVACSSKKHYCKLVGFLFQSLCFIEKRSNLIGFPWLFCLQSPLSLLLILTRDTWSREGEGKRISLSFLSLLPITPCPPFSCASCFPFPTWVGTKRDDCGNESELATNLFYLYPQCDKRTLTVD